MLANLDVARMVAASYARRWPKVDRDDLLQEAYVGLVRAAQLWRPDGGAAYRTYAVQHCVGAVRHYLRDRAQVIRRPRHGRAVLAVASLDAPVRSNHGDSEVSVGDCLSDPRADVELAMAELRADLVAPIQRMSIRQQRALGELILRNQLQTEVARKTGYSREHISRLGRGYHG